MIVDAVVDVVVVELVAVGAIDTLDLALPPDTGLTASQLTSVEVISLMVTSTQKLIGRK